MAFKDLYPTPSARRKKTIEDGLVYCQKCGFPCRTAPLRPMGGDGNSRAADIQHPLYSHIGKGTNVVLTDITVGSTTYQRYVPNIVGGCPNCGTYLFNQETKCKDMP